jgi:hypothetical protein
MSFSPLKWSGAETPPKPFYLAARIALLFPDVLETYGSHVALAASFSLSFYLRATHRMQGPERERERDLSRRSGDLNQSVDDSKLNARTVRVDYFTITKVPRTNHMRTNMP